MIYTQRSPKTRIRRIQTYASSMFGWNILFMNPKKEGNEDKDELNSGSVKSTSANCFRITHPGLPPIDGDLKGYLSGRSTRTFHTPPSYGAGWEGEKRGKRRLDHLVDTMLLDRHLDRPFGWLYMGALSTCIHTILVPVSYDKGPSKPKRVGSSEVAMSKAFIGSHLCRSIRATEIKTPATWFV